MNGNKAQELVFRIPKELHGLIDLAYNLHWSWDPDARQLFKDLDKPLWDKTKHNAVEILNRVSSSRLNDLKEDTKFIQQLKHVIEKLNRYISPEQSWFLKTFPDCADKTIAYLSMEYGLHNSIKIYSGGLGILAGDHLKESSDLGFPLVAVGFLYTEGYFIQEIPIDGWQKAHYSETYFSNLPITEVNDPDNPEEKLIIPIFFNDIIVKVKIWLIKIGSIELYLLDTNIEENPPWDRGLTDRLYGGSREQRLKQEKILGIGAVKLFKKLKISPSIYHLNEGHCAFSSIERMRNLMLEGQSFQEALGIVRNSTVFTTHTPVPAGHDVFSFDLMETYFQKIYIKQMGIENFFSLGSFGFKPNEKGFNMTALGIRTAKYVNCVSKLHRDVTMNMFSHLFMEVESKYASQYVPLSYITNGTHIPSFVGENIQKLLDKLDGDWRSHHDDIEYWKSLLSKENLPDKLLWQYHQQSKNEMFQMIRESSRQKILDGKWNSRKSLLHGVLLDPEAFTIGFARRFATYKRATLIFNDLSRVLKLFQDENRPLQIIFSGKAHPADDPGKKLIQEIVNFANSKEFGHRIAFIEDYGLSYSKMLVQGVDVWLNNPLRPYEASGTSGMKASSNFVPNLSILDGWWAEGYNGKNGWAINPDNTEISDPSEQDKFDACSLYDILEKEIIPAYYERNEDNVPVKFVDVMRESLISCLPQYSSRRMLKEYAKNLYLNAIKNENKKS